MIGRDAAELVTWNLTQENSNSKLNLKGFSLIALAVLVALGLTWLLWVREVAAKKR